jgi:anti-sigma factor RsiW
VDLRNRTGGPRDLASSRPAVANLAGRRSIEPSVMEKEGNAVDGLTCRELSEFLDDYLAGELVAEVRTRFEAHLVECRDCVTYLRDYRATVQLLHETGHDLEADATAEAPPELLRAIRDARKRGP